MQTVGFISEKVIALLGLKIASGSPIYLGASNVEHMKSSHPADFTRYGADIANILKCPDFVGVNPSDGSIEYVKEYTINNEHVKVAVRISAGGKYYARSLYVLNPNRVKNFIAKGTLKKV